MSDLSDIPLVNLVSLADRAGVGVKPTKEGYAGRIGLMQRFSIITKVLGTVHQLPHLLQHGLCSRVDLRPSSTEATYGRCAESGNNGGQSREIIHCSAFLR